MKSTTINPVIFAIAFVVAFGASVVSAQETRVEIVDVAKVFKTLPAILAGCIDSRPKPISSRNRSLLNKPA